MSVLIRKQERKQQRVISRRETPLYQSRDEEMVDTEFTEFWDKHLFKIHDILIAKAVLPSQPRLQTLQLIVAFIAIQETFGCICMKLQSKVYLKILQWKSMV